MKSFQNKPKTKAQLRTADRQPVTRPRQLWILLGSLALLSIGGFIGGIGLLADSSGSLLGMTPAVLENAIVKDFFWPGVFLLFFMALLPLFVMYALWARPDWKQLEAINPWKQVHWSLSLTAALGVFITGWIIFQITQIGPFLSMQIFIASLGVLMVVGAFLPQVRAYYAR